MFDVLTYSSLGSLGGDTVDLSKYIGHEFRTNGELPVYFEPAGKYMKTYPTDRYIGSIETIAKQSDGKYWAKLKHTQLWFNFNAYSSRLKEVILKPLTDAEKKQANAAAIVGLIGATGGPAAGAVVKVGETSYKIVDGAAKAADSVLDAAGFLGENLKYILWTAVIIGGVIVYKKVSKGLKTK